MVWKEMAVLLWCLDLPKSLSDNLTQIAGMVFAYATVMPCVVMML